MHGLEITQGIAALRARCQYLFDHRLEPGLLLACPLLLLLVDLQVRARSMTQRLPIFFAWQPPLFDHVQYLSVGLTKDLHSCLQ